MVWQIQLVMGGKEGKGREGRKEGRKVGQKEWEKEKNLVRKKIKERKKERKIFTAISVLSSCADLNSQYQIFDFACSLSFKSFPPPYKLD